MFSHAYDSKPRFSWRLLVTFLPAAVVAFLPKCPLCLVGIMSALGLGTLISGAWLKPLTLVLLLTAVGSLTIGARRGRGYKPLLLGFPAAAIVFVSKFYLDYPLATYGGLALLLAATFWGAWAKERAATQVSDCGC
jgi:hypothetical protein